MNKILGRKANIRQFQIFFFVIWFGLFHGLLFLPVLLSLVGPSSRHKQHKEKEKESSMDPATWRHIATVSLPTELITKL